jgi:hypothetical protein
MKPRVGSLIAVACLWLLTSAAEAAIDASVDRDQVAVGDEVELTLQRDGRASGQPDLKPLERDFDVLGTSSGSSIQISNGQMSSSTQLRITLSPKHAGTIEIPPLQWDGEQSAPVQLTVAASGGGGQAGGPATAAASQHVYIDSTPEPANPYLQSAVVLTVRIHADQPLYQASLNFDGNNDVSVQQIGKDRQTAETVNSRRYDVIERQYLLVPQRSGSLSLDGPLLDAQIAETGNGLTDPFFGRSPFAGMMNATRPLHLRGDPVVLDVRPRPVGAGADWIPATALTLEESWKPADAGVHAGEPLTRHLHLRVTGLTGAQLPDLGTLMNLPDGIKAYPDQPKLDTALQDGKVVGTRDQDIALIAARPGRYELPELRLQWWDTAADRPRDAILPARTLDIAAAPADGAGSAASPLAPEAATAAAPPASELSAAGPTVGASGPPPHSPWPWVSLGLALLWLGTLAAWWRSRRRGAPPALAPDAAAAELGASAARNLFFTACRANDSRGARRNLLAWSRAAWPADPPPGLHALAGRLTDPIAANLVRQLDRACYTLSGTWDGAPLSKTLIELPRAGKAPKKPPVLAELYP